MHSVLSSCLNHAWRLPVRPRDDPPASPPRRSGAARSPSGAARAARRLLPRVHSLPDKATAPLPQGADSNELKPLVGTCSRIESTGGGAWSYLAVVPGQAGGKIPRSRQSSTANLSRRSQVSAVSAGAAELYDRAKFLFHVGFTESGRILWTTRPDVAQNAVDGHFRRQITEQTREVSFVDYAPALRPDAPSRPSGRTP